MTCFRILLFLLLPFSALAQQRLAFDESGFQSVMAKAKAQNKIVFYMLYADWCPHCQDQKALFGGAAKRLPYIECSPGGQGSGQTAACRNAGINTYPTWEIGGRRYAEVLSAIRLAELSGFDLASAAKAAAAQQTQ